MESAHISTCIKDALNYFEITCDKFASAIEEITKIYVTDGEERSKVRSAFLKDNRFASIRSFISVFLRAFPPGRIQSYTTGKEIYKAVKEFLIALLEIATNGCSAEFISSIAGEVYEGRNSESLSVAFAPSFDDLKQINDDCKLHKFFELESFSDDLNDLCFDDSNPGPNGQRRAIRKALELTKKGKDDSIPQCLVVAADNQKKLYMVGLANRLYCRNHFPTVEFSGPSSWSFALPNEKYTFRCISGKVLAPHPKECQTAYFRETIRDCLCKTLPLGQNMDEKQEPVYKMLEEVQEQKHGTSMVWLWGDDAKSEKERLCDNYHRGYPAYPHISADESNAIKSITGIDGALLCDINTGECIAYGVILDGEANEKATRARGARYNSIRAYLSSKKWTGPAFAAVVSEDGFVDVISAE